MIVVVVKARCLPGKAEEVLAAARDVVQASRAVNGVMSFHICRDVTDPHVFIATEVYQDRAALERQESLPAVKRVLSIFGHALAGAPETTLFDVSSSESREVPRP